MKPKRRRFHGKTYDHGRDHDRLSVQYDQVFAIMKDGRARTLTHIRASAVRRFDMRHPLQSISARLRDARKTSFGGHTVEREYAGGGLWRYRLILRKRKTRGRK